MNMISLSELVNKKSKKIKKIKQENNNITNESLT
jgi:hypothetical protein